MECNSCGKILDENKDGYYKKVNDDGHKECTHDIICNGCITENFKD